jgi:cytochrome c oxidase assembly factor CtaG
VTWTWRPDVVVALALLALAYGAGWARLARRSPARRRPALLARLALALAGVGALAVALLGLHEAAHASFSAHMAQHLLVLVIGVPAILLADPLAAVLWALPARARHAAGRALTAGTPLRRTWRALTAMPVAWSIHALVLWLWHVPAAYDAALASGWLHDLEHLAFAGAATLFWWPVIRPAPRTRPVPHPGWTVAYLLLGAFQSAALGLWLARAPRALYGYTSAGALEDQAWGGVLMWGAGGAVDMLAVLLVVYRVLSLGERATTARLLDAPHPVSEN